jgi:signal transduction histidine kinase
VLSIEDQGIGIPAGDLEKVFVRFHRAQNAVGQFAGSGLGLATAKQVVEQHGGSISVSSSEGRGSTFTIRLPLGGGD